MTFRCCQCCHDHSVRQKELDTNANGVRHTKQSTNLERPRARLFWIVCGQAPNDQTHHGAAVGWALFYGCCPPTGVAVVLWEPEDYRWRTWRRTLPQGQHHSTLFVLAHVCGFVAENRRLSRSCLLLLRPRGYAYATQTAFCSRLCDSPRRSSTSDKTFPKVWPPLFWEQYSHKATRYAISGAPSLRVM